MKKAKKIVQPDTAEQALLRKNLLIPCGSKEHLKYFLLTYLGVDLVDGHTSRFSTCNPLDAAWQMYEHALYYTGYDPLKMMFVASRSSQKTLLMAAIETLLMIHDKRDIIHLAAIEVQAAVAWGYVQGFFGKPYLRDLVVGKPTADQLKLRIPDLLNPTAEPIEVIAKVLSITPATVQGQHASVVIVDELLTLQYAKRRAFEDINGIPDSDKRTGKPYIRAEISSRKGASSLVEERIGSAADTGLIVKTWNVLDVTKKCEPSRYGTIPTKYYGSPYLGKILTPGEWEALELGDKQKYYEVDGYDGCTKCSIASFCLSDLSKQHSSSRALKPIEKLISDYKSNSLEWWLSQALSLMPSSEGLVYGKFKKDQHVKTANDIWKDITGESILTPISTSTLVEKMHSLKFQFHAGLDHTGGTGFAAIVVTATAPDGSKTYVLESFAEVKLDLEDLMTHLARLQAFYKFGVIYADPAWADKNALMVKKGFPIRSKFKREVETGIEILRTKLMGADGTISLYLLDEKTKPLQNEFSKYHYAENSDGTYSNDPFEAYCDNLDSLRYIFVNVFGKMGKVLAPEFNEEEKKLFKQDMQIGEMSVEDWLQQQISSAVSANRSDAGLEPEEPKFSSNPSKSLKWII